MARNILYNKYLPPVFVTFGAVACMFPQILTFERTRRFLDQFGSGGRAEAYSLEIHSRLESFADLIGLFLLVLGVVAKLVPDSIWRRCVDSLRSDFRECIRLQALDRNDTCFLIAITLAGVIARLQFLNMPIRYDEAITYLSAASRPIVVTVSSYYAPNNHIFHSVLVKLSCSIFGPSPAAIRLPTLLAGIVAIPMAFFTASSLLYRGDGRVVKTPDRIGPLAAAVFVCCSQLMIEYSVNARGYMICSVLTMAGVMIGKFVVQSDNKCGWILLGFVFAIGLWTIPTMVYPIAMLLLWLGSSRRCLKSSQSVISLPIVLRLAIVTLFAAGLTILLYSPVLAVDGYAAIFSNSWVSPLTAREFFGRLPSSVHSTLIEWGHDIPCYGGYALLMLTIVALWYLGAREHWLSLPMSAVVGSALLLCAQRVIPFNRVWVPFLSIVMVHAGIGMSVLVSKLNLDGRHAAKMVKTALVVLLMPVLLTYSVVYGGISATNQTSNADCVMWALVRSLEDGDVVASCVPTDGTLDYYFMVNGLKRSYLSQHSTIEHPRRLFVVVNVRHGDEVENVVRDFCRNRGDIQFARPRLVEVVGMSQIWICDTPN